MTVVLAHGTFDMLHPGHIAHLQAAKALGDELVVSVTADEYVLKGPGRPYFPLKQRMDMLKALACVDRVIACYDYTAVPSIYQVKPAVYVKGRDYEHVEADVTGKIAQEIASVELVGGRVEYTDTMLGSSSHILNRMTGRADLCAYLGGYTAQDVLGWLDKCNALTVHVMGERIQDKYVWVEAKGKSPKGNNIVYQRDSSIAYRGGVLALAAHAEELSRVHSYWFPNNLEMVKTRYIDKQTGQRVYSEVDDRDCGVSADVPAQVDNAIAVDYGHGFKLDTSAQHLALTVQANSLSSGYNFLSKYERATYVVVDEIELRLSCGDATGPLEPLVSREFERMHLRYMVCTVSSKGCIAYDGHRFVHAPAIVDKVVDTTGAGDAFLAYTAPLAFVGAPVEVIALVGNVAAGLQCQVWGNERPVSLVEVKTTVKAVMA